MLRPTSPETDRGDEACVVAADGELDLYAAPALRSVILSALGRGASVVVDMAEATFIDSTALGVLVHAARRTRPGGLAVACANREIVRVFELTRIDRLVPVYASVGEALAAGRASARG